MRKTDGWATVILATAIATGLTAGARAAEVDTDLPSQAVHYADLNLNSMAGATALYRRIARAADQVCGQATRGDLAAAVRHTACRDRSIERAVGAVNSRMLTDVHAARTGRV